MACTIKSIIDKFLAHIKKKQLFNIYILAIFLPIIFPLKNIEKKIK